jgi:hypothetical protein
MPLAVMVASPAPAPLLLLVEGGDDMNFFTAPDPLWPAIADPDIDELAGPTLRMVAALDGWGLYPLNGPDPA